MFGNFEYHLRVGETGTPRWDRDFFKGKIDTVGVARVYVVGPTFAVQGIREALEQIGIHKENIWDL